MGKKSFNASKFHALLNLSVSRLAVLRSQRGARCNLAQSDVVQILKLGQQDRALLRVEQVVKEQNMLDVFVMMEGYCHLMAERVNLIEHERECPEELREAVASMLYASTRCGEFPELQEMRAIFTARYGKEFVARATELRNNCGVNPKIIQKLSTRTPILESRLKVLKEIAAENNIVLQIEEVSSPMTVEGKLETVHKQQEVMEKMESFSDSMKAPRKYKDVADAAQAAFKSAAYAAVAARAAVELSKSGPHDPNDQNGFVSGKRKASNEHEGIESELLTNESNSIRMEDRNVGRGIEKVIGNQHSESEDEEILGKNRVEEDRKIRTSSLRTSSLNSDVSEGSGIPMDVEREIRPAENESDETRRETGHEEGGKQLSGNHQFGSDMKPGYPMIDESLVSKKSDTVTNEDFPEKNGAKLDQSEKKVHVGFRAGLKARLRAWHS